MVGQSAGAEDLVIEFGHVPLELGAEFLVVRARCGASEQHCGTRGDQQPRHSDDHDDYHDSVCSTSN